MAQSRSLAAEAVARLVTSGPAALDDQEALEVAAGLTAAQAAALFAEFGSLPEVLAASTAALSRLAPALGAARVALLKDVARRLLVAPLRQRPVLSGWQVMADYLRAVLAGRSREQLLGLFLDKRNRLIRVHLTVRALADDGTRLNPKKADLEAWRRDFARALRELGVEAEATPRRARGVTRKAERPPIRRLRERLAQGRGPVGHVAAAKLREAARVAFGGETAASAWDHRIAEGQLRIRRLYLAQARLLQSSQDAVDRALGVEVETFVRSLQPPDTERLALARALREANERARSKDRRAGPAKDRS